MCRQDFIEPKVFFVVIELGDRGRKMDRLSVPDPRLLRHSRKRNDLNSLPSQCLDINSKDTLQVFKMKSCPRVLQDRVRCPGFESEVAAARFRRVVRGLRQPDVDPLFELFERYTPKSGRA